MASTIDISKIRADLSQSRLMIERGRTIKEGLAAEEASEVNKVGLAKGRALLKEPIDKFLQAFQAAKYEQTIGLYRELLSAIVHDVIDPDLNIDLAISTERGAPSLEVLAYDVKTPDHKVNVYNGCGGAMINVVSAGLRAIAVARSGQRPFLVLDEPDCWIKPDRVPAFFNVLHGLCRDLKFQIIVISHHGRQSFGDCHIIEAKSTDTGLEAYSVDASPAWHEFDGKAFRHVHYRDFASIGQTTIDLVPGLNVIYGDNNIGKSRILRAFRSAFYGGGDDGDIKLGKTSTMVEFVQNDGFVLEYSREKKRNPVNLWRILKDGAVVTLANDLCSAGGREVPGWVGDTFGISNKDDLSLQLSNQLMPVFALDKPASQQAALLSTGRETGWIRQMMAKHKENVAADNATIKRGEAAIVSLRDKIAVLPDYAELEKQIENGETILDSLAADQAKLRETLELCDKITKHKADEARFELIRGVLADLPVDVPVTHDSTPIAASAVLVRDLLRKLEQNNDLIGILADLPLSEPVLEDLTTYIDTINVIDELEIKLELLQTQVGAFADLPAEVPALADSTAQKTASSYLQSQADKLAAAAQKEIIFSGLPEMVPVLDHERAKKIRDEVKILTERTRAEQGIVSQHAKISQMILEKETQVQELREKVGDECPICASPMGDILHKHDHAPALVAETVAEAPPTKVADLVVQPPVVKTVVRPSIGGFRQIRPLKPVAPEHEPQSLLILKPQNNPMGR